MNREIIFRGKRIDNGERMTSAQIFRKTPKGVLTNLYSKMKERNIAKGFGNLPFTLSELHSKYLGDKTFCALFSAWENSEYEKDKKPSFDRINPTLGYSLENIKIKTWGENRSKADWEKSFIYTTPVVMFDENGKLIREFGSTKEASIITGLRQSGITSCCQGRYKSTGGYVFKYRGDKYRCRKTAKIIGNIHDGKDGQYE